MSLHDIINRAPYCAATRLSTIFGHCSHASLMRKAFKAKRLRGGIPLEHPTPFHMAPGCGFARHQWCNSFVDSCMEGSLRLASSGNIEGSRTI